MSPESIETVRRYMDGELDLASAAQALQVAGDFGLFYEPDATTPAERERVQSLFAHFFWLKLREESPGSVPERPFTVAEFRAFVNDVSRPENDEAADHNSRPSDTTGG